MEAEKLKKKKGTINKGKVKKTIKNVICRPDPVFWPVVTESEGNLLETTLTEHRVCIPDFKKPHWNDLKSIPKNERPKPPPIEKVDGLLFGISACRNAIQNDKCSAVLIEALIEPQMIVHPIIEACTSINIPVVCLKDLKIISRKNFGIQTSCLSVEKDSLPKLSNSINEIYLKYKPKTKCVFKNKSESINIENENNENKKVLQKLDLPMDIDHDLSYNPYLYRTNKKTRVFVPSNNEGNKEKNQFVGQNFIKLPEKKIEHKTDRKEYMKMILKKISNNPNRVKVK